MSESPIGSTMLKARLPLILDLPEQAWFDVALLHKDLRLALEAARPLRAQLPSARTADAVLDTAERLGYAHRDIAAVHEVLALHADELTAAAAGTRELGCEWLSQCLKLRSSLTAFGVAGDRGARSPRQRSLPRPARCCWSTGSRP